VREPFDAGLKLDDSIIARAIGDCRTSCSDQADLGARERELRSSIGDMTDDRSRHDLRPNGAGRS
jgi:hypothetical protein